MEASGRGHQGPEQESQQSKEEVHGDAEQAGSQNWSEEEEIEEEPLFKYQRLDGPYDPLFRADDASAIATSAKLLAMGTHSGLVHIYTHAGRLVKRYRPHSATIHDVKIDCAEQFVCVASMDGKISILPVSAGGETYVLDLKRPMRSIALEPLYHKHPNKRQFIAGGLAGNLTLYEKGWLGNKEIMLHSGEGPIWAIQWKSAYVAWANDSGIRILDINTHAKIAYLPRGRDEPRADLYRCHFYWETLAKLLIGWGDTIRVINVKENGNPSATVFKVEEIFQVECVISGICAWEAGGLTGMVILAHTTESSDSHSVQSNVGTEVAADETHFAKRRPAQRPELRVISSLGEETSSDALSINSFTRYQPNDYSLCLLPPPNSGKNSGAAGNSLYVMSPKDLILVEVRNWSDHISWMIEHGDFKAAMREVEEAGLAGAQGYSLSEIGEKYLGQLVSQGAFEAAAQESPAILANDAKSWEDWIFMFAEKGILDVIIPYIPTDTPRLSKLVYEVVLVHHLRRAPHEMLRKIQSWSPELYDLTAVISATLDRLSREGDESEVLMTCLSELYILNHQPGKALKYFLRLRRPGVFDLIKNHNLFTDVQDQALLLIKFDDELRRQQQPSGEGTSPSIEVRQPLRKVSAPRASRKAEHGTAINMLVEHTYAIPVAKVIDQLIDHRQYLYMYLDALFDFDPLLASDFADLHIDLCAEFDRTRLMEYLRAGTNYNLEKAYEVCKGLDIVPEMVYLLGRMGNNKKALFLIIDRIGDVQRAIEFAKEQNDQDLWEDLLRYSETRPPFIRGLLNTVGSEIDPVRLIRRIQNGLEIPGLKASIIKILQDFNLQISLIEGCRSVLVSDYRDLSRMYYASQTMGALGDPQLRCQKCDKLLSEPSASTSDVVESDAAKADTHGKPEEAMLAEMGSTLSVMFLCRHSFHSSCVFDSNTVMSALAERRFNRNSGALLIGNDDFTSADQQYDDALQLKFAQTLILKSGSGACPICTPVSSDRRPQF